MAGTRAGRRGGAALALLLGCLCALAGCSRGVGHARLSGRVPASPARVGAIVLPEVHADRRAAPFLFQPPPGHLLVVYFGYTTCPDVCPTTLSDLHRALTLLGSDASRVELAFVTVDLARDTAEVLAPYVSAFVDRGHALRPENQAQLAVAERAFGATSSVTKDADGVVEVSHTGSGYLVDDQGRIVDEWPFGLSSEQMAHDVRILLPGARP